MKKITTMLILAFLVSCQKSESIIELTTPITYGLVKNAIQSKKPSGDMNVQIRWKELKEVNGYYHGRVNYTVQIPEYPNQIVAVDYMLNGSRNVHATVTMPNGKQTTHEINLYDGSVNMDESLSLENQYKLIVKEMAPFLRKRKVAVFNFVDMNNKPIVLGDRISESLATNFVQSNIMIVERRLFESINQELRFQETGITTFDDQSKKIGQWLGADTVVTGTIQVDNNSVVIYTRAIDLSDISMITTVQTIIPKYLFQPDDFNIIKR